VEQVCIAKKKDNGRMYAMKYMNKLMCARNDSLRNVLCEVELLKLLQHPFLVNLWFTFHDDEDLFIVVDLLLGGDLRYHMHQSPRSSSRSGTSGSRSGTSYRFDERRVKLYVCELSLALDYLRQQLVIHRCCICTILCDIYEVFNTGQDRPISPLHIGVDTR